MSPETTWMKAANRGYRIQQVANHIAAREGHPTNTSATRTTRVSTGHEELRNAATRIAMDMENSMVMSCGDQVSMARRLASLPSRGPPAQAHSSRRGLGLSEDRWR
jgi:hypothetical protein